MEAVRPYIDAVLPHVEAAKEATLAGVEATRPYMESAAVATGDAAGYMYGAAKEATIAGLAPLPRRLKLCARTWKSWPAHLPEPAHADLRAGLCAACAQPLWFFVFDCFTGVQVMTMHGTSAHRFSYDGNPRWEVADRSVLNLLEQTPLFPGSCGPRDLWMRTSPASSACAPSPRGSYPVLRSVATPFMEFSTQGYWFASTRCGRTSGRVSSASCS